MTSIKPLALIAREIVAGTSLKVGYLLAPTSSEHNYALKISDVKRLNHASLVIWLDSDAEPYLESTRAGWLNPDTPIKSLKLLDKVGAKSGVINKSGNGDHHGTKDPHVWLSPLLTKQLAQQIADRLSEIYPVNKQQFVSNMLKFDQKMTDLDKLTADLLLAYTDVPFLTQHDGYGYFVNQYGLNQIGVLQTHQESALSLKHLRSIQNTIHGYKQGVCLFNEPQLSHIHIPGLDASHTVPGELDLLGINADTYEGMINNLTGGFVMCFRQIKRRPDLSQAL